jgi:nicotinamidase-related amidase
MLETDAATQIWEGVLPEPLEVVVVKRRVSAFTGSGLEVILRAQEIDQLILCGISTSGVVLSTLRQAADQDYGLTVLSDACLDSDPEVHRVLIEKIFLRQARVLTVSEWQETVSAGGNA